MLVQINLLEEQLRGKEGQQQAIQQQQQQRPHSPQSLQQQLAESQQQLASTQQQLHQLQEEHRQYVAHSSTLLTQLQTQVQQLLTGYHTLPQLPSLRQHHHQQQPSLPDFSSRLRPAQASAAAAEQEYAGTGGVGGLSGDSSSTDRLLQISSYIQQQLQEQEAAGVASHRPGTSSAAQRQFAAASTAGGGAGMGSPDRAAAAGWPAGSSTTASACTSPSRRTAALQFTPAVADTLALPSYAAMRQQSRAGAAAAAGSPVGRWQPGCTTAAATSPRGAGGAGAAAAGTAEVRGGTRGMEHVGSPRTVQATQLPRPLPGTLIQQMQKQKQRAAVSTSSVAEDLPPSLSVRAPTARAAAAAVWEAELASSPRPQQMLVPEEHAHYYLNNASGEAFGRAPVSTGQLSGDLAALLRDLGLASLELTAGGGALAASGSQGVGGSSGAGAAAAVTGMGTQQVAAAERVPVVLSEAAAAPAAATAGGLLRYSRGDGVLTGQQDVDRGLEAGLPMAAVSRVFTAAGCVSDRGKGVTVRPGVLAEQLKGNMCFRDHLRAAAAADTGDAS